MANYSININWYNEIKGLGITENPYIYKDEFFGFEMVEVDILDEAKFIEVSKELGWMV